MSDLLSNADDAYIISLSTSATGATFVTFSNMPCEVLEVANNTGTVLEYQREGTGPAFPLFSGMTRKITAVKNANEIGIRRVDQANTVVSVVAEAQQL